MFKTGFLTLELDFVPNVTQHKVFLCLGCPDSANFEVLFCLGTFDEHEIHKQFLTDVYISTVMSSLATVYCASCFLKQLL